MTQRNINFNFLDIFFALLQAQKTGIAIVKYKFK